MLSVVLQRFIFKETVIEWLGHSGNNEKRSKRMNVYWAYSRSVNFTYTFLHTSSKNLNEVVRSFPISNWGLGMITDLPKFTHETRARFKFWLIWLTEGEEYKDYDWESVKLISRLQFSVCVDFYKPPDSCLYSSPLILKLGAEKTMDFTVLWKLGSIVQIQVICTILLQSKYWIHEENQRSIQISTLFFKLFWS